MSKTRNTGFLTNVVQYNTQGDITFVSGSTTLLTISSSGEVITTGVISGSNALSSSYSVSSSQAENAALLDNLDSTSFVYTSSFNSYSSSVSGRVSDLESTASVLTSASASFAVVSSSFASTSGSIASRVTKIEGNYATTGSNAFNGSQNITGSLTVSQAVIAQTLNVQQVTSSIVYSCGSNIFGCAIGDVQQMTGSVRITGSLNTIGNACITSVCSPSFIGGTMSGTTIYGSTAVCGGVICGGATTLTGALSGTSATFSGNGIFGNTSVSALNERLNITGNGIAIEATDAGSTMLLGNFGGADGILGTFTNDNLQIRTNNVARLTIANTGAATFSCNVGIGEAARTTSTLVINNTNAKNELTFGGSEYTNIYSETTSGMQFGIVSSGNSAAIEFFTNNAERMRITSCGNVTICTIDNQGGLTVTSAQDNTTVRVGTTATGGQEWRIQSTGGTSGLGQGKLFFKVGTTEAGCNIPLVLTTDNGANGARVGIGTTSPQDKLYVIGADNGITICSATANRPVLSLVNGSTTMLKLSANGTYGAIASCTGDLMYFYGDKIGVGITTPSFAFEVNSSNNTAITSNNTFGANLNIIFNRDNTGSTRNCFNILADQNSAYLRTLDNYPITFVTNGQNRTVISNTGIACFACQVCAPNFKFTQYGSIQSFVGSVAASGTKTITICTDGGGVLNGALQVTVGLFVNGAGGNSVVSWIVGGYMGAGAMRIVEVARSSDTYGCIGVMTNPANCLIFTVGNCFAFNGMDYSVMVTSVNANTSALKIY